MMKMNSMRKLLSVILCMVLIAAMALLTTGCGSKEESPATVVATEAAPAAPETTAASVAESVSFTVIVTDVEGKQTTFEYTTDKTIVGEVLLEEGLIEGEEGPYGLYIKTVNGTTLDYEKDGKYWAFYENGEYALTGVDMTEIIPGATYELKAE